MVWPWYVVIAATLIGVLAIVAAWGFDPFSGWSDVAIGIAAVAGLVVFLFGIFGLVISIGRHYDRVQCRTFAQQTERQTRFVIYNTFSWDCITPTANGKWISTSNLREFGDGR